MSHLKCGNCYFSTATMVARTRLHVTLYTNCLFCFDLVRTYGLLKKDSMELVNRHLLRLLEHKKRPFIRPLLTETQKSWETPCIEWDLSSAIPFFERKRIACIMLNDNVWRAQTEQLCWRAGHLNEEEYRLGQCSGRAYPFLWGMMPHHWVIWSRRFKASYWSHLHGATSEQTSWLADELLPTQWKLCLMEFKDSRR
jgi:hypothetical protein